MSNPKCDCPTCQRERAEEREQHARETRELNQRLLATAAEAANRVTAGELRTLGLRIPETIPDCAWVPRTSLVIGEHRAIVSADGQRLDVEVDIGIGAPFRWVEAEFTVKNPTEKP